MENIEALAKALTMTYEAMQTESTPKSDTIKEEAERVTKHYKFFPECNRDGLD